MLAALAFYPKVDRATVSRPSAEPVGVGTVSQPWTATGERYSLLTRIATTESVSLCTRMKS